MMKTATTCGVQSFSSFHTLSLSFFLLVQLCLPTATAHDVNDGSSSKIFPYNYTMRDLTNGLRVVIIPTDYPSLVSLQIPVQVGSRNDIEPGKTGFAHFFEHMMFGGTAKHERGEFDLIYQNAGASYNAGTSSDYTKYYVTLPKEDLDTALMLESDRFLNLKYTEEDFKTEAGAILGEYNFRLSPYRKLREVQRNVTYSVHPYKHTTMGKLEDIMDMPNQYEWSKVYFDRYYRPEYTSLILAGDLETESTFALVEKYFGGWGRGNFTESIPQEPLFTPGPVYEHVEWEASETLPYLSVAFRGPAFSDTVNDMATMDVISNIAFSSSSKLYQKLVLQEKKVDRLFTSFPDSADPFLLTVFAKPNDIADTWYVRDEILKTFAHLRLHKVSETRLEQIKSKLYYGFANAMDSTERIAKSMGSYMTRTREPETVNRVYQLYDSVTTDDVISKSNQYFVDDGLAVVTLSYTGEDMPQQATKNGTLSAAGSVDILVEEAQQAQSINITSILKQTDSPIVAFRILYLTGVVDEPKGKEGLAKLTANMVTSAGSISMSYEEIREALTPMAASFGNKVDKEMTVFYGKAHVDHLDQYYEIVSKQLLSPGWDEGDFDRIKTSMINGIKDLKTDETSLSTQVLYEQFYEDHPYGSLNRGHIASLEKLTLEDVQSFYEERYTRANLVLGTTGNYNEDFLFKLYSDLGAGLPEGFSVDREQPLPRIPNSPSAPKAVIVETDTSSTAISMGFAIDVIRGHPDYAALMVAASYLGTSFTGRLFKSIREERGLNYGAYASIRYGGVNSGRQQEMFSMKILPVDNVNAAHFATRTAMYELNKMVTSGISEEDFERVQNYLLKSIPVAIDTQSIVLAYAMDSLYYGTEGDYSIYIANELSKLTVDHVNRAISDHLQNNGGMTFSFVTKDAEDLRLRLANETTSVMTYEAEKPAELLEEDKIIQDYPLGLNLDAINIIQVENVFSGLNDDEVPPVTPKVFDESKTTSGAFSCVRLDSMATFVTRGVCLAAAIAVAML